MTPVSKKKKNPLSAVGRRKTATARVRFVAGGKVEDVTVNGKTAQEYFPVNIPELILAPVRLVAAPLDGHFEAKVSGGGSHSQAEAIRHGISRILLEINAEWRGILKSKGMLRRDDRMKERKKPGLRRARRSPQWSKR